MKRILLTLAACLALGLGASAQRLMQPLGRGVVAVQNNNSQVTITWRRLAQEPERTRYNVYVGGTKLNSSPLLVSNLQTTAAKVPVGSSITVTSVVDGVESAPSLPFVRKQQSLRNIYMEITFKGGPLNNADFSTKYVWPCDLNGNGEMDYVVDRNSVSADRHYIEAYLADGTYLWTVDLGPNESSSSGQDDQICAYDIDCDGKGEVLVQTSDGTRFWDKAKNDWGLYVKGSTTGDTDGDGIIDYNTQGTKNPPKYFSVIDGMTGAEKASVEQRYDEAYNRTNKASLMGDEYNKHVGHVGIFYPDGIHPAIVMEWHTRTSSGAHQYRNSAFSFDFKDGKATNWHQLFMQRTGGATFHQIRILDADGDGRDEMSSGAYCMDHDGTTLYNTGIAHGDRHRTSDIDPERPGLETFSIQQDAGDMLGMILFDAATGEPIKKWYLAAVGDVGRGECMDLDPTHIGWEMFSTMDGYQLYNAKGDAIPGKVGYFPTEGIWWDGQLDRERVDSPDGSGYNADIRDYTNGRLIEMAKESGYTLQSSNAKRGKFWGDIIGDWREELILSRVVNGVNTGIVGFSTDYTTTVSNIYCLLQDPHYNGDCTTKGYYQSPNPGFYLGYDMPRPPLPPVMQNDEESEVFDLSLGNATIKPVGKPNIYAMAVKGQTLTLDAAIPATSVLWKSQQGTLKVPGTVDGQTIVSEGTVQLDGGTLAGALDLRARGTLSGHGTVKGSTAFEGALNYEGCRLMPQGTLTFDGGLSLSNKVYMEMALGAENIIVVKGNFTVAGTPIFNIKYTKKPEAGEYKLLAHDADVTPNLSKFTVMGLTGLKYKLDDHDGAIWLVVQEQRDAATGVYWAGSSSSTWDYKTVNWLLDGEGTEFVAGDAVTFDASASKFTVTIPELFPIQRVNVEGAKNYTFQGDGGFTGTGKLVKSGTGTLTLNTTKSDFTGGVSIEEGTVSVKELADAGIASSLGSNGQISIGKAKLVINNASTSTDRAFVLGDEATLQVASGTTALKGVITGKGRLVKAGAGQVNIGSSSNSWTGGTELQAGTLAMGTWNAALGANGSAIDVTGNATIVIFDNNSTSAVPNLGNAISVAKGKTLTVRGGQRCRVTGSLSGEGTYAITMPYVRGDISTNCAKFQGTYDVLSSNCRLIQAIDLSRATLKVEADGYIQGNKAGSGDLVSYTHKVGALAGSGNIGMGTWNVGYLNTDCTFAGAFDANAVVQKYGTGMLTLSGASKAPITVNAGGVVLGNTAAETTTGIITVKNGATLSGAGKAQAVSVQKGGTIKAGKPTGTTVGTMTLSGNLTVATGGILEFRTRVTSTGSTSSDRIRTTGTVKLTSPTFNIVNATGDYAEGQEYTLFAGTMPTISGTIKLTPEQPAPGLLWDTTRLATEGILTVTANPDYDGIMSISEAKLARDVYDLNGRRIAVISRPGLYLINGRKVVVK